jgi:hypothetical protein
MAAQVLMESKRLGAASGVERAGTPPVKV